MKATRPFKTLGTVYSKTRCHTPEESSASQF